MGKRVEPLSKVTPRSDHGRTNQLYSRQGIATRHLWLRQGYVRCAVFGKRNWLLGLGNFEVETIEIKKGDFDLINANLTCQSGDFLRPTVTNISFFLTMIWEQSPHSDSTVECLGYRFAKVQGFAYANSYRAGDDC